jgi:hypothetical protein
METIDGVKTYKTTKADFAIFVKELKKWLDVFQIGYWEITYDHEPYEGARAVCMPDIPNRMAVVGLNSVWIDEKPTERLIKHAAFHEVCEILLAPMIDLATARYAHSVVEPIVHAVIQRISKAVFDPYADKK